jgi:hypothetical protein
MKPHEFVVELKRLLKVAEGLEKFSSAEGIATFHRDCAALLGADKETRQEKEGDK